MTQELESPISNPIPLSAAIFFVEVQTPHRWSSGPITYLGDPYDAAEYPFSSLAAAQRFAEKEYVPGHNENSTKVTYGVRYQQVLSGKPLPPKTSEVEA
jgi:hypothetical protein